MEKKLPHEAQGFLRGLDEIIARYPERPALAGDTRPVTYGQLHGWTLDIQARLQAQGVRPGDVVAIHTDSRAAAIAAILAVLRAGCAYLPLDPVYPSERLDYMLGNAAARVLVTDKAVSFSSVDRQVLLDPGFPETLSASPPANLPDSAAPDSTAIGPASDAYIIYTSGSTGRPKGVRMNHGTLDNLIRWQNARYPSAVCYRTLQFSSLSFDVSFQEIFATLTRGGCLFLVSQETRQDFRALLNAIDRHRIERIFLPYIALLQLCQWARRLTLFPQSLREVITAGEQLVISRDIRDFFAAIPGARLANQYGPSESHVVTEYLLPDDVTQWAETPPIGKPIDRARILLLDEQWQAVPKGQEGEIFIAGPVLANGYINNAEETSRRFVELALAGKSSRAYRTGDLAVEDADGNIHYKGRLDSQVKISGYRVELSEVEARLLQSAQVAEAAVAVQEWQGERRLVAFVKPVADVDFSLPALRAALEKALPAYMLPADFHQVDALLKTPTGKIDRKSMLARLAEQAGTKPQHAGASLAETLLAIIRRELQQPKAQPRDNLLNLGMTSLGANRLAAACYDELQLSVAPYCFFQHRSIQSLLDSLVREQATADSSPPAPPVADVHQPVAIIGMAVKVPGAEDLATFWDNLLAGRETIHFFPDHLRDGRVNARGLVHDPLGFDEAFFDTTPLEARFIDPQQRVLLELAWHALEDAGYVPEEFPGRIGVFCGTGNNSYYLEQVLRNPTEVSRYGPLQAMIANEKDYCATRIAFKLNLVGPAVSVHTACSTSLVAVCQAVDALRNGQCDIAIAGAASVTFPQQQLHQHEEGSIYTRDGHTRTFDKDASGTVFSDGAGLVVLKRLDYAQRDGDRIYAAIQGVAVNNDGADKGSFSAPSVDGQKRVILAAQQNAGIEPDQLGYIEAHGTATPLGDPIEVAALTAAFRVHSGRKTFCRLGSIKSNLGHLTAAAGVVGLIKSALSVYKGQVPPTINFTDPNPELHLDESPFVIADSAWTWDVPVAQRRAGVSSFGIGGTNAHVVLGGVTRAPLPEMSLPRWLPLCFSAHSLAALTQRLADDAQWLERHPDTDTTLLAAWLLRHRAQLPWRKALVLDGSRPLPQQLMSGEPVEPQRVDTIVFAFPGQGSQLSGMGLGLYRHHAGFRRALDACADILRADHQVDLLALLQADAEQLHQTANTQIALFCVAYALTETLAELGIRPQAAIGHSIGELAAASLAGVFDLPTAIRLVLTRGRVMQAQPPGAMLAVRQDAASLAPYLEAYPDGAVVIAARNTPDACTLAGDSDTIATVQQQLKAAGISSKALDTSHAFHSPAMDDAKAAFARQLADVRLQPPQVPFISCVTGDWITPEQATDIHYWADQLRQPVAFAQGIGKLAAFDHVLVIECGPQRVVSGMIQQTLSDKDDLHLVPLLALAGQEARELRGFSQALGRLWELGLPLDWPELPSLNTRLESLPRYPFQHKTHVIEAAPLASIPNPRPATVPAAAPIPVQAMTKTSMKDSVITHLKAMFSDLSGMDLAGADPDARFFELGLDSLLLTQSAARVKKTFNIPVSFKQLLNDYGSLNSLAGYLLAQGYSVAALAVVPATQPQVVVPDAVALVPGFSSMAVQVGGQAGGQVEGQAGLIGLLQQQMQLLQNQLALLAGYQAVQGQVAVTAPATMAAAAPAVIKPFGAGTRINIKRSNEMTETQKQHLAALGERYNDKFKSSKAFAQANRQHLADPRVVSGFRNPLKELIYPIVVTRSEGAYLWELDGSRLVDITCGFGSNFFGNGAPFIKEAVARQLETGYEIGPQHPLVAEAAQLFCEITGNERVAFCNTGSEAVLGAIRLARTVTAKEKIVIFENDYHGINDEVIVTRSSSGFSAPAAAGIPDAAVENVIVLDYGDEKSLDYIREHADQIAGLLVEPVQSRYPELQPREFLRKVRQLCSEKNIALIFDEVITGFRIDPRGAQGYYQVDADICTYGKIVGGGMPIGVISGKADYLDALDGGYWQYGDDSAPEVGVTYFAGTFVRHPLALAAAVAVLRKLKEEPGIQAWLNARADHMMAEINDYAALVGAPVKIANCGSMCKIKIPQDIPYEELIYVLLREKGVHVWDARPTFITTAHSDEDIAFVVKAFKEAMDEMLAMEFFPRADSRTTHASPAVPAPASPQQPPVPGARLGRDESGRATWYVPSAADPTRYEKWQG